MRVAIVNGEAQIICEHDGRYAPDIMKDLQARARELYRTAFYDEVEDEPTKLEEP